jgi:signal transduction histidine kinase
MVSSNEPVYHRILQRQISRVLKNRKIPKLYQELFTQISHTYDHFDNDRVLLERAMEISSRELEAMNANLLSQKTQLESAYQQLQQTQSQLVHAEKMALLGQLVASIAHEINTPLGAINGAADFLQQHIPLLIQTLPELYQNLSVELRVLMDKYIQQLTQTTNISLSTREERSLASELTTKLTQANISPAPLIAMKLIKSGFRGDPNNFLLLLQQPNRDQLLDFAFTIGRLFINVRNILVAVSKTQKIVYALKSYSYNPTADEPPTQYNLIDNIDTVLTIYHNQLKSGIELVQHYPSNLIQMTGWPENLNQVWSNIIHNAIQAMGGKGLLEIEVVPKTPEQVVVMITDNGPGIPPEIQEKIFAPFFTTKKQGEGTGLGLDICRRIIEKHKGAISVQSVPGRTTFFVNLPVNPLANLK